MDISTKEMTFTVGEAAERVGLTTYTLRWYEQEGLVAPVGRDSAGRRRSGGPGAGRPAKLYRRSAAEHAVTLPPRDYRLLADVLASAVERAGVEPAAYTAAHEQGAKLAGGEVIPRLEVLGYEPWRREWFVPVDGPHLVLWWIPADVLPTITEAAERLDLLRRSGPSPEAFTLREPYPAPGVLAA